MILYLSVVIGYSSKKSDNGNQSGNNLIACSSTIKPEDVRRLETLSTGEVYGCHGIKFGGETHDEWQFNGEKVVA
ncbi:MAG: hypothetical protein LBF23_00680 [Endomicrobium sp.]|nr:hypothetical protein [Endomicrobium sp.]